MPKMYILGCSHAAGSELGTFLPNWNGEHDKVYNKTNSFAAQFAKLAGYEPVNLAISGGCNDAMFRQFMDILDSNKLNEDDKFFASWTGESRTELYYHPRDKWQQLTLGATGYEGEPGEAHDTFMKMWCGHDSIGRNNKIKNICTLNYIAEHNNIKVINHNAIDVVPLSFKDNFYWVDKNFSYVEWADSSDYKKTEQYHFELAAHTDYANQLLIDFLAAP